MTEKRPGPAPGVLLIEVSVKRELTVLTESTRINLSSYNVLSVVFQFNSNVIIFVDETHKSERYTNLNNYFFVCLLTFSQREKEKKEKKKSTQARWMSEKLMLC